MQKYVYLLEHLGSDQPVNIGIFTSMSKAKAFIKTLPKKHPYAVYKLPTNTKLTRGRKLEDVQGSFGHWHFGTNEVELVDVDDEGNVTDRGTRTDLTWPG